MITQSTFLGTVPGRYPCLFFLLVDPFLTTRQQLGQELHELFQRFGRALGDSGLVVEPFQEDVDKTLREIHAKNWTDREREHIDRNLPGLLMLNVSFDEFDPQRHPWIHFYIGGNLKKGVGGLYEFTDTLRELAEAVKNRERDIFVEANAIRRELIRDQAGEIFEAKLAAKPEIICLSIDLIKGAAFVRKLRGGKLGMIGPAVMPSWRSRLKRFLSRRGYTKDATK